MGNGRGRQQSWMRDEEVEEGVREFIEGLAEASGRDVAIVDDQVHIVDPNTGTHLDIGVTASPIAPEATKRFHNNQRRRRGAP